MWAPKAVSSTTAGTGDGSWAFLPHVGYRPAGPGRLEQQRKEGLSQGLGPQALCFSSLTHQCTFRMPPPSTPTLDSNSKEGTQFRLAPFMRHPEALKTLGQVLGRADSPACTQSQTPALSFCPPILQPSRPPSELQCLPISPNSSFLMRPLSH